MGFTGGFLYFLNQLLNYNRNRFFGFIASGCAFCA